MPALRLLTATDSDLATAAALGFASGEGNAVDGQAGAGCLAQRLGDAAGLPA